jgi:hypothetical protein
MEVVARVGEDDVVVDARLEILEDVLDIAADVGESRRETCGR